MKSIRVVHFGLGPIGKGVLDAILDRQDLALVGVVDIDPDKAGQDAGAFVGRAPIGLSIEADGASLLSRVEADVAVVATTSKLAQQEKLIVDLVDRGMSVVSTCEELSFPWSAQKEIAQRIDDAALRHGRAVLGTGVNPGFVMDHLPLVLSGAMKSVRAVRVERIQDPSRRRKPFQDKVGVNADPAAFEPLLRDGRAGHVGLRESAEMVAHALGLAVERFEETRAVLLAERRLESHGVVVETGRVRGVEQIGRLWAGGRERITLVFRAELGEPDPRDHVWLDGDPPLSLTIAGGVPGDVATCALIVNAIPAVTRARPGLRTMAEMEPLASRAP